MKLSLTSPLLVALLFVVGSQAFVPRVQVRLIERKKREQE